MKKCNCCKQEKDESLFYENKAKSDKLSSYCKECSRSYQNKHYSGKKQYYKDKSKHKRKYISLLIKKIKESFPCKDCKIKYPYYVMDFDHLYDKKYSINTIHTWQSFNILFLELSKCELVCSNCHRIRTHNRRIAKKNLESGPLAQSVRAVAS